MKHIGLMGRVGVSFFVSTVLPLVLMFLMFRGDITMGTNMAILILAGLFLICWIYMGIVRPVDELKAAAKRIESGDLDFTLEAETNDEFGELMQAFDEMRIRLKDLKTPLTAIKGYSEGLLDGVASSPEMQRKYIRTINNKAAEMDRLIDELRYYVKVESDKIPYDFQHICVKDYFQDCAEEIGLDMDSQGIRFSYRNTIDPEVEMIADPEQLRKVISNIISNSVKYMDKEEKEIALSLEDAGDFIQVNIRDNGKGISRSDLPYIFQRFFRADSSRNSMKGGSGIGLSIVKKIIEDSGGRIWASSKEGEETTIHFVLRKYIKSPKEA